MPETTAPRRIGSLDGIAQPLRSERIEITVEPPLARYSLRLAPAALPAIGRLGGLVLDLPINRHGRHEGAIAARLGPDEWLLLLPEARIASFVADAARLSEVHHALTDVGHRNAAIGLRGNATAAVLASGCPLDLERMTAGDATRTLLGKTEIVLLRFDDGWRIECWRSFAGYVHAYLAEAAREYTAS